MSLSFNKKATIQKNGISIQFNDLKDGENLT